MRHLFLLILLLSAGTAVGQDSRYSFSAIPNPPTANQPFQIRVTAEALSCYTLPDSVTVTQPAPNVVQYEMRILDGCLPLPEQQRLYTVPALPAGPYTVRLARCISPSVELLPTTPCGLVAEQGIVVAANAAAPNAIPAMSSRTMPLLIALTAVLGAFFVRRF
jgi:hypothetical protein